MPLSVAKKGYDRIFFVYATLFVVLSVCGLCYLSGCKGESHVNHSTSHKIRQQTTIESKKIAALQKKLKRLMEPVAYHYTSEEKVDPFQPFLRTAPKIFRPVIPKKGKGVQKPKRCSNPLECMDIGQLTLVAIITRNTNDRIAMAQDAAGIGYFLYPGLRVGYQNGKIKKILSDRVIIEEKIKDFYGKITTRKRVMLLHPEEK